MKKEYFEPILEIIDGLSDVLIADEASPEGPDNDDYMDDPYTL